MQHPRGCVRVTTLHGGGVAQPLLYGSPPLCGVNQTQGRRLRAQRVSKRLPKVVAGAREGEKALCCDGGLDSGPWLCRVHVAVHAVDADVGVMTGQGGIHARIPVVGVLERETPVSREESAYGVCENMYTKIEYMYVHGMYI